MKYIALSALLLLASCQQATQSNNQPAELIGANATWGNTEGPAIDSKGNLYFTSRGSFKGIISWNEKDGFKEWLAVATKEGPGGLYFDQNDNMFVTATGEQQILKITPDKKVSIVAENFDVMKGKSKGPNDLVVTKDGTIYFTEPNGYDGSAPKGTIYRISKEGKTEVFSQEVTGPNGIILSADEQTLYVAHNIAQNTSNIVRWSLPSGKMELHAKLEPCQADGMDVDKNGNLWLTCYSHGIAHLIDKDGKSIQTITTAQKALTNAKFGRGPTAGWLFLSSSDMDRVTGYVYRAKPAVPGIR
jgi:gluconolactonase